MRADDLVDRYGRKPKKLRAALRKSEVYEAEVNQRLAAAGWPALKAKAEALDAERSRLLQQILDTRAVTPQGMLAKLAGMSEPLDRRALESVVEDLRALANEA
jgi:hypothetical protein